MTVLITGGNGFVGKHLQRALKNRKINYISPTSSQFNLLSPLSAVEMVFSTEPTAIIHLAGNCGGIGYNQNNSLHLWRDNLLMGINLLDAIAEYASTVKKKPKIILVVTICSYQKTPETIPFIENEFWNGYPEETNAPYGIAKKTLLVGLQEYSKVYKLPFLYLIPTNMLGEGDDFSVKKSHVVPALIKKVLQAPHNATIDIWGTGIATRDFLYVTDFARIIGKLLDPKLEKVFDGRILNVGTGKETSIRELCHLIVEMTKRHDIKLKFNPAKTEGQPRRVVDNSALLKIIPTFNFSPLKYAISRTINWYLKQQAKPLASTKSGNLVTASLAGK